ncbi:MAG: hypothetical protein IIX90_06760 [Clostridia bacterium]|nr:hypothetical protein [Clostridia bacterium]
MDQAVLECRAHRFGTYTLTEDLSGTMHSACTLSSGRFICRVQNEIPLVDYIGVDYTPWTPTMPITLTSLPDTLHTCLASYDRNGQLLTSALVSTARNYVPAETASVRIFFLTKDRFLPVGATITIPFVP